MYFRRPALGVVFLSLLTLSACGLKVGESSPVSSVELGMTSTACLKGGDQVMLSLFDGTAGEAEVTKLWDCASQGIQVFMERTRGEKPGVYSPKELRGFLEAYFLNSSDVKRGSPEYIQISDRLLGELMYLKRALVGGSIDVLTADELNQARRMIQVFKEQSLRLRPYFPIQSEHLAALSESELHQVQTALDDAAHAIGLILKQAGYGYGFTNLDALLEELGKIASTPEVALSMEESRRKVPLLQSLKGVLVGPERYQANGLIAGQEWVYLLESASRAYGIYLTALHHRSQISSEFYLSLSQGRENLLDLAVRTLDLLDDVARRYPGEGIPLKVFENLIDHLEPEISISRRVTLQRDHLKKFLCPLALKILAEPPLREDPCWNPVGTLLSRKAIARARKLFNEWAEGQKFLDLLIERQSRLTRQADLDRIERSKLLAVSIPQAYGKSKTEISQETWAIASRIRGLISARQPFFRDEEEMVFDLIESDPVFSRRDLNHLNLMSFFGRLLITAYAGETNWKEKRISEQELKSAYLDFRDLGVDFKIFDPRKNLVYKKRLVEANLFTQIGNGDEFLNAEEAAEILAYMYSSKNQAKRAHELIADICNHGGQSLSSMHTWGVGQEDSLIPLDLFGYELIGADCYRREYFRNHHYVWKNFPKLEKYYLSLSGEKRVEFTQSFEKVARTAGFSQEPFDSTDSESLGGLAHYIETFFQRFDRNGDGLLSEDEAINGEHSALPILRNTLETASCRAGHCFKKKGDLQDLLTYLMYFGQVPEGTWSFLKWKATRPFLTIQADRGRLIEILAKMSSFNSTTMNDL